MSHADSGMRGVGVWLAPSTIIPAVTLVFHRPIAPDSTVQMRSIADGILRWAVVRWTAAVARSFFTITGLVALIAGSRPTREWWKLSAWAPVPVGALWTVTTAAAKATAFYNAAVTRTRAV